jgi:hypothetical protein
MAAISDLEPCRYLPLQCEGLLAVGWLEHGVPFEQGRVAEAFFAKLKALCSDPWQPVVSAGLHRCSLCQFDGPAFNGNVFIPYAGCIYVAPVGIVHYIAAHWYRPPEVFVAAVLACPPMRSMEYKRSVLAHGGRSLVGASGA